MTNETNKTTKPRTATGANKLVMARDAFFERNASLLAPGAHGKYLRNRLECAFIAGWDAAMKAAPR